MIMSKVENSKCLLLNADYTPLKIISWQRAISWSFKYKDNINYGIEIIEFYKDKYIQGSCGKKYEVPLVAKTINYFNIRHRQLKLSRRNIFIRDNYTCQYCGKEFDHNQLTYDHVIPKSKYKPDAKYSTNWNNIATACVLCNRKKSNKTPEQANMVLLNIPKKPSYDHRYLLATKELYNIKHTEEINQQEWVKYIHGHF
jgi:5-methylcytosine-specific restriction endonuclease McrA